MPVKEKKKVCDFCGPYEKCSTKLHNTDHIRDLLVDAGIIEDTTYAFNAWFRSCHTGDDKEKSLLGYSPDTVWPIYSWRVAKYVRAIL